MRQLSRNTNDTICTWDDRCDEPQLVAKIQNSSWRPRGSTKPEAILQQPRAVEQIRSSDVWFLLTDGQILDWDVTSLTNRAGSLSLTDIPMVFVIVGNKTSEPRHTNISVVIPFFASVSNAVILYKDAYCKDVRSSKLFLVAAKGCFGALFSHGTPLNEDLSDWNCLPKFADEDLFAKKCEEINISLIPSKDRQISSEISLGPTYSSTTNCKINVDILLGESQVDPQDLKNLLDEEAIKTLAVVCKARGCLGILRSFLTRHKRQGVAVRLEDRHRADEILRKMNASDLTPAQMDQLRNQLRVTHSLNRSTYVNLLESPNEEILQASELNRLLGKALELMTSMEKAHYTADILCRKSNRAMRADKLEAGDADLHLLTMDLSDEVNAFRGACSICAGNREIMSIALKRLDSAEDNTTDFALNFPLAAGCNTRNVDMVSSQCICFQCALLCKKSIFQEELAAILPTVGYNGANERYLNY